MSTLVSGVTTKLQDLLPGRIGTNNQWSESYIASVILLADAAAKERCEMYRISQEIDLVADQHNYDLDSGFIDIEFVEFASDGSTYDRYLTPATLDDLDCSGPKWRVSRTDTPEEFALLSTPGTQETSSGAGDGAKITIHPTLSAAVAQKIKVTGLARLSGSLLEVATAKMPDDVQNKVHVPYVMQFLFASKEPKKAERYRQKYLMGCNIVRDRFRNRYSEDPSISEDHSWR